MKIAKQRLRNQLFNHNHKVALSEHQNQINTIPIHGYMSVFVRRANEEEWKTLAYNKHNLLTNAGRDFFHNQVYTNTSAGTQGGRFIAVTTDSGAPAAGDTTLASEITTNGLTRAAATTNTHTGGTNTSALGITYTASGAHNGVQKSALFNASSGGIMTHENTFASVNLVTNDQLAVAWTLTLG